MKDIKTLTASLKTPSNVPAPSTPSPTLISQDLILTRRFERLSEVFSTFFGGLWTSRVQEAKAKAIALEMWKESLSNLSENEFMHGLKKLTAEWPDSNRLPMPVNFREYAKTYQKPLEVKKDTSTPIEQHIKDLKHNICAIAQMITQFKSFESANTESVIQDLRTQRAQSLAELEKLGVKTD